MADENTAQDADGGRFAGGEMLQGEMPDPVAPPDVDTYLQMRDEDFDKYLERVRRHRDELLRRVLRRQS